MGTGSGGTGGRAGTAQPAPRNAPRHLPGGGCSQQRPPSSPSGCWERDKRVTRWPWPSVTAVGARHGCQCHPASRDGGKESPAVGAGQAIPQLCFDLLVVRLCLQLLLQLLWSRGGQFSQLAPGGHPAWPDPRPPSSARPKPPVGPPRWPRSWQPAAPPARRSGWQRTPPAPAASSGGAGCPSGAAGSPGPWQPELPPTSTLSTWNSSLCPAGRGDTVSSQLPNAGTRATLPIGHVPIGSS